MEQLQEIKTWLLQQPKLALHNEKATGYFVLFDGAGTDKIETAETLAKEFNKELYRIDLSKIMSKYIGETEKNLAAVFKKAEDKKGILFFDEADALFGKRTGVKDSHDRYANQEISYLLQKIEAYNGLVILATNAKENIDSALLRRFRTVVHFTKHE